MPLADPGRGRDETPNGSAAHAGDGATDGPFSGGSPRWRRLAILRPLTHRDFALLWTALGISLLGDGIFLVAIAWQTYDLSNHPGALSMVFLAWTGPLVVFLLIAGVISDRFERRRVMIASDVVRGVTIGIVGVLALTEVIQLWHLIVLVAIYGCADAFFFPAFGAIVPDIVPQEQLVEANSLDQFVTPFMERLVGPAAGGFLIAAFGVGQAFLADAASFAFSAGALLLMSSRRVERSSEATSPMRELRDGFRFVRAHTWLWGTLTAAAFGLLCFFGPRQVLLPLVIRRELGGGADELGLVLAMGGVGSILAAALLGQRGLPRRAVTFMYAAFSLGTLPVAAYAIVNSTWQAMAATFFAGAGLTGGMVVWGTLMHRLVPSHLLGRVSSFDWMVSTCLVPLSFAITGPIAAIIGIDATLIGGGLLGTVAFFVFLYVPGMRDIERDGTLSVPLPKGEAQGGLA
jgi:Transmembrane secretion effector